MKSANPQGKGLVPILQAITDCVVGLSVPPKAIDQIAGELFTSLFVLNSEFRFNPLVGRSYWLYRERRRFRLSVLAPDDWPGGCPGQFIGECMLQQDLTWTLQVDGDAAADPELLRILHRQRAAIERRFQRAPTVKAALPIHERKLSYYQRVLAFGVGRSLGISMQNAGIGALPYDQAKKRLTAG